MKLWNLINKAKGAIMAKKEEKVEKSTLLEAGKKVKVVDESEAMDRSETVRGLREGKVGKYGN